MPEFRRDPVVDRWVIVAKERANRPHSLASGQHGDQALQCPFCEEHESETPPEVFAIRDQGTLPNSPGWQLRIVPNKYPAVDSGAGESHSAGRGLLQDGLSVSRPAQGVHEVIIESQRHVGQTCALSTEAIANVFMAYQSRLIELSKNSRWAYALYFKNVGEAAGATLEHLHSQLLVLDSIPSFAQQELAGALDYFQSRGSCVYCDLVRETLEDASRIVAESDNFLAFCPFASRVPLETWILPKRHACRFDQVDRARVVEFAGLLRQVLHGLEVPLAWDAYNYWLHQAPLQGEKLPSYHWHLEILPRSTKLAGFELGAGWYINTVPPEEGARRLREALAIQVAPRQPGIANRTQNELAMDWTNTSQRMTLDTVSSG